MDDHTQFDLARAKAIKAYGSIELSLASLISALLGIDFASGSSIIFRVSNTRARYAITHDAFRNKKPEYQKAWQVVEKWLRPIDTARNHVVHWQIVSSASDQTIELHNPPNILREMPNIPTGTSYSIEDLTDFQDSAEKACYVLAALKECVANRAPPAWPEKFQQLQADQKLGEFHQALIDERQ